MNAKTDRWEVYTDKAGRRHWRWPASSAPDRNATGVISMWTPVREPECRCRSRRSFAALLARGK